MERVGQLRNMGHEVISSKKSALSEWLLPNEDQPTVGRFVSGSLCRGIQRDPSVGTMIARYNEGHSVHGVHLWRDVPTSCGRTGM